MKKLSVLIALALAGQASASTLADSRSVAMGGTGVASANYISASLHNPALAANHSSEDGFGMLLPTLAARIHDGDDMIDELEDFQDINDNLSNNPSEQELEQWRNALRKLDGNEVNAEATFGLVIAIPNSLVSTNFFTKANGISLGKTIVDEDDLDLDDPNFEDLNSFAQAIGGGTLDIGLSLAKSFETNGGIWQVGVSPKYQRLYSLNYKATVDSYEDDDFDIDDRLEKSGFNIDLGTAYHFDNGVSLGLAGRNLVSRELKTNFSQGSQATFQVKPEFTAAAAFTGDWYQMAFDIDLNKRQYFKEYDYKLQYARLGAEVEAKWAQVRVGYAYSITSSGSDLLTAGFGFTPWGKFGLDLSGQVGKDDHYALSAQFIFTL